MLGGGAKNLHQWESQKFSHLSSKTAAGSGHEFSKYVRTHVLFDITHLPSLHPSQASSLGSHFTLQACIPTQKKGRMSQVGPLICGSSSACVSRVPDGPGSKKTKWTPVQRAGTVSEEGNRTEKTFLLQSVFW